MSDQCKVLDVALDLGDQIQVYATGFAGTQGVFVRCDNNVLVWVQNNQVTFTFLGPEVSVVKV